MDMITGGNKANVLSFNYTNPFRFIMSTSSADDNIESVSNVHGTYEKDDIIFGVDATEELLSDTFIFSKTYRKMLQGVPNRALPMNIKEIKFYGHSLGKADYSYFQSIFDFYNLYGDSQYGESQSGVNPVTLQFYFTIYNELKEIEIERSAAKNVYELISAYGKTLDNKDKGKNLLHKLLLEGRIQIKFLEKLESPDGKTLDNKDKGKNLLHKLLLKGRN